MAGIGLILLYPCLLALLDFAAGQEVHLPVPRPIADLMTVARRRDRPGGS